VLLALKENTVLYWGLTRSCLLLGRQADASELPVSFERKCNPLGKKQMKITLQIISGTNSKEGVGGRTPCWKHGHRIKEQYN